MVSIYGHESTFLLLPIVTFDSQTQTPIAWCHHQFDDEEDATKGWSTVRKDEPWSVNSKEDKMSHERQ